MMCAGRSDAGIGVAVWALDFKTRQYLKGSLWFLPLLGGITGALLGLLEPVFARRVTMPGYLEYSASTASVLLASIVGATAALTGFVVTVSVLVVQMATSSFSARYMRLWYRDRVLHILLALLVGTFTFSFTLLAGVEENSVPHLGVSTTGALMAADIFLFLFFLGRFVHRLRPVAVAALTAAAGRNAFDSGVRAVSGPDAPVIVRGPLEIADEPTTVVRTRSAGSIQALDAAGLVRYARRHRGTFVLNHTIGDFVPAGRVLIAARGWPRRCRSRGGSGRCWTSCTVASGTSIGPPSRTSSPGSKPRWRDTWPPPPTSTVPSRPIGRDSEAHPAWTAAKRSSVQPPGAESTGSTSSVRPFIPTTRTDVPGGTSELARACQSSPRTRI
jgi:hypothetical protein